MGRNKAKLRVETVEISVRHTELTTRSVATCWGGGGGGIFTYFINPFTPKSEKNDLPTFLRKVR